MKILSFLILFFLCYHTSAQKDYSTRTINIKLDTDLNTISNKKNIDLNSLAISVLSKITKEHFNYVWWSGELDSKNYVQDLFADFYHYSTKSILLELLNDKKTLKSLYKAVRPQLKTIFKSLSTGEQKIYLDMIEEAKLYIRNFDLTKEKEAAKEYNFVWDRGRINAFIYRRIANKDMSAEDILYWLNRIERDIKSTQNKSNSLDQYYIKKTIGDFSLATIFPKDSIWVLLRKKEDTYELIEHEGNPYLNVFSPKNHPNSSSRHRFYTQGILKHHPNLKELGDKIQVVYPDPHGGLQIYEYDKTSTQTSKNPNLVIALNAEELPKESFNIDHFELYGNEGAWLYKELNGIYLNCRNQSDRTEKIKLANHNKWETIKEEYPFVAFKFRDGTEKILGVNSEILVEIRNAKTILHPFDQQNFAYVDIQHVLHWVYPKNKKSRPLDAAVKSTKTLEAGYLIELINGKKILLINSTEVNLITLPSDQNYAQIYPIAYNTNMLGFENDQGLRGAINMEGKLILEPKYLFVNGGYYLNKETPILKVYTKSGLAGLIGLDGKMIIAPNKYSNIITPYELLNPKENEKVQSQKLKASRLLLADSTGRYALFDEELQQLTDYTFEHLRSKIGIIFNPETFEEILGFHNSIAITLLSHTELEEAVLVTIENPIQGNDYFFKFKVGDKFGIYDFDGKEILKPEYVDLITPYELLNPAEGVVLTTERLEKARFLLKKEDEGLYALFNKEFQPLSEHIFEDPRYEEAVIFDPETFDEIPGFKDKITGQFIFPNQLKEVVITLAEDSIQKKRHFFKLMIDGQYGLYNFDGKEIVSAEWDDFECIQQFNQSYWVGYKNGLKTILDFRTGKVLSPAFEIILNQNEWHKEYEYDLLGKNRYLLGKRKGQEIKFALCDENFKQLTDYIFTEPQPKIDTVITFDSETFEEIRTVYVTEYPVIIVPYHDKVKNTIDCALRLVVDGKLGLYDFYGKERVAPNWNELEYDPIAEAVMVTKDTLFGIFDLKTHQFLESPDYKHVRIGRDQNGLLIAFKKEHLWGLKTNDHLIFPPQYTNLKLLQLDDNKYLIAYQKNGKWGIRDLKQELSTAEFSKYRHCNEMPIVFVSKDGEKYAMFHKEDGLISDFEFIEAEQFAPPIEVEPEPISIPSDQSSSDSLTYDDDLYVRYLYVPKAFCYFSKASKSKGFIAAKAPQIFNLYDNNGKQVKGTGSFRYMEYLNCGNQGGVEIIYRDQRYEYIKAQTDFGKWALLDANGQDLTKAIYYDIYIKDDAIYVVKEKDAEAVKYMELDGTKYH
ncbi:MAG: hypothetical protein MK212_02420 [Saprospiraceae bacterium]|nr:hypothetical protein [Saprospiraceae bacterium]